MSQAGQQRPEEKVKPFVQAALSAPPRRKLRKQQVTRAALNAAAGMSAKYTQARKSFLLS
jgi:hypothetical protein